MIVICTADCWGCGLHGTRVWQEVGFGVRWGEVGKEEMTKGFNLEKSDYKASGTDLPKLVQIASARSGRQGALGDGIRYFIFNV